MNFLDDALELKAFRPFIRYGSTGMSAQAVTQDSSDLTDATSRYVLKSGGHYKKQIGADKPL